jgi:hypothetical protein
MDQETTTAVKNVKSSGKFSLPVNKTNGAKYGF